MAYYTIGLHINQIIQLKIAVYKVKSGEWVVDNAGTIYKEIMLTF